MELAKTYIRISGGVQNMYEAWGYEHIVISIFLMCDFV